jgi:hypothetical protein
MPVCISCGHHVDSLTRSYGKGNVQLIKCGVCNNFADKYVENESIIIFLDMLLQKPAVYRHLLLNQSLSRDRLISISRRLFVLLILFEVYARWSMLRLDNFLVQYLYLLSLCFLEFSVYHIALRFIIYYLYKSNALDDITCAIIISSFGKLLLLCLSIWDYNDLKHQWLLSLVILMTNSVALSVMLNRSRLESILVLMAGVVVKVMVQFGFTLLDPRLELVLG